MESELDEKIVHEILKIQKESNHSFGAKNYMVSKGIENEWHDAYFKAAEEIKEQKIRKSLPWIIGPGVLINIIIIYYIYFVFSESQVGNPYYSDIKLAINSWVMQLSPFFSIVIGLLAANGIKNKLAYKARLITVAIFAVTVLNLLFLVYIHSQVY